jgi:hypothetical protein
MWFYHHTFASVKAFALVFAAASYLCGGFETMFPLRGQGVVCDSKKNTGVHFNYFGMRYKRLRTNGTINI